MNERYIGLMSGTSLDGIDGVLVEWDAAEPPSPRVLGHVHLPFEPTLAAELLALNASGSDELHRAALAGNAVARLYAAAAAQLLKRSGVAAAQVRAIGAHGQTVRHRPQQFDGSGYTLQLNNPALLAELAGIDVVADLRSRDLAAGGQGAPLVPAFHRALFARPVEALAVLNLGGIANLTLLGADGSVTGFDCGPANALLDHWVSRHRGEAFDADGHWAAGGQVDAPLLASFQAEPYFEQSPPKSTGRDLFHPDWLARHLDARGPIAPADVQATLAELTAWACARDLRRHLPTAERLLVCGGGAFNGHLMRRLATLLPGVRVGSTAERGLPPDQVEACAFAWLARAFIHREPASLPSVTGARGARVLGCLYPR
ncbi:MAG: anhydro-N-acetylmuramic acid kinase [Piscinibacter sp.]|uniref:anhydro-N-acetylmuramic acid kinase n=1 Tax=Piscinibacter sp. TaxID=1903157 RepID=UPI003D0DF497